MDFIDWRQRNSNRFGRRSRPSTRDLHILAVSNPEAPRGNVGQRNLREAEMQRLHSKVRILLAHNLQVQPPGLFSRTFHPCHPLTLFFRC